MEKFFTLHEVAKILALKENEVVRLADQGEITAYRIGGSLLRFKLRDIDDYQKRKSAQDKDGIALSQYYEKRKNNYIGTAYRIKDRIYDFFYYYDFYIIIALLITLLLIVIFKF